MGSKVKCLYSNSNVDKAIKEIKAGKLSANQASKKYGIPKSTLGNKLRGKCRQRKPMGRDPYCCLKMRRKPL